MKSLINAFKFLIATLLIISVFGSIKQAYGADPVISIDFVGGSPEANGAEMPSPMKSSEIAGAVPSSNWNNAPGATGTVNALIDNSGRPTSSSVTWQSTSIWATRGNKAPGNQNMMGGYLDTTADSTTSVLVSRLSPAFTGPGYDVYVYFNGDNPQKDRRKGIYTIGNSTLIGVDGLTNGFIGTFTESERVSGGNYVCFRGLTVPEFTLRATPDQGPMDGARRAPLNAIQIVAATGGIGRPLASSRPSSGPDEDPAPSTSVQVQTPKHSASAQRAADRETATAYAASAAKLASDGKTEKAKELCYAALAQDESCPEALYELGKLFEKDGNPIIAGEFLARACQEFGKLENANPQMSTKRMDAERRIVQLNPHAAKMSNVLADYVTELNQITKKSADNMTLEEACDRADALKLRTLPPDKAPKFDRPANVASNPARRTVSADEHRIGIERHVASTAVSPEVERALKASGWTTITGTWIKKAEGVYEVTDGKLQADLVNGALQVVIFKGNTGTVKAMVRNSSEDYSGSFYNYGSGYGVIIKGTSCKLFDPTNAIMSNASFRPMMDREIALPDNQKQVVLLQVVEGNLEITINSKREHKSNYKISKEGPFVIEVTGTATIESPRTKGL